MIHRWVIQPPFVHTQNFAQDPCVQKPSNQPRRHIFWNIPLFGTNASRMELLRPFFSTAYICGRYISRRVCKSCIIPEQIQHLLIISDSNSITRDVLQAGNYFWVPSFWSIVPTNCSTTECNNVNCTSSNEGFYHYQFEESSAGSSLDPSFEHFTFWSNINVTNITDEAQGRVIEPGFRFQTNVKMSSFKQITH